MRVSQAKQGQGADGLRLTDVFVMGGTPRHTYIAISSFDEALIDAKSLSKIIHLTGPTKSGKTIGTERVFPEQTSIWIQGTAVSREEDLWLAVQEKLEFATERSVQLATRKTTSQAIEAEAGGTLGLIWKALWRKSSEKEDSATRIGGSSTSLRLAALKALGSARLPLIVDDFHHISRNLQEQFIAWMKPLVHEGIPVILITIPRRANSPLPHSPEMDGRIYVIEKRQWEEEELMRIPKKGFELLGVKLDKDIPLQLARECFGSPYLMQELCFCVARAHGVLSLGGIKAIDSLSPNFFRNVSHAIGSAAWHKLLDASNKRACYAEDGERVVLGQAILNCLGLLIKGWADIPFDALFRELNRHYPRGFSKHKEPVKQQLEEFAQVSITKDASAPILDWSDGDERIRLIDPLFAFFLKHHRARVEEGVLGPSNRVAGSNEQVLQEGKSRTADFDEGDAASDQA